MTLFNRQTLYTFTRTVFTTCSLTSTSEFKECSHHCAINSVSVITISADVDNYFADRRLLPEVCHPPIVFVVLSACARPMGKFQYFFVNRLQK